MWSRRKKVTRNFLWIRKLVTRERRKEEPNQQSDDDDDNFFISDDDRLDDDDDDNVNTPVRDEPVQQRPKRTIRRPEKLRDYITV